MYHTTSHGKQNSFAVCYFSCPHATLWKLCRVPLHRPHGKDSNLAVRTRKKTRQSIKKKIKKNHRAGGAVALSSCGARARASTQCLLRRTCKGGGGCSSRPACDGARRGHSTRPRSLDQPWGRRRPCVCSSRPACAEAPPARPWRRRRREPAEMLCCGCWVVRWWRRSRRELVALGGGRGQELVALGSGAVCLSRSAVAPELVALGGGQGQELVALGGGRSQELVALGSGAACSSRRLLVALSGGQSQDGSNLLPICAGDKERNGVSKK